MIKSKMNFRVDVLKVKISGYIQFSYWLINCSFFIYFCSYDENKMISSNILPDTLNHFELFCFLKSFPVTFRFSFVCHILKRTILNCMNRGCSHDGDNFTFISFRNTLNRSPRSQNCHKHPSSTSI